MVQHFIASLSLNNIDNISIFSDCLNHLCLKVPQAINKNRELILELLKHGASKMPNTCQEIILAIVPLVKRFTSFRENLIILLRSSLSTW